MAKEIEHKYLVKSLGYLQMESGRSHIVQGYLSRDPERTVRVRLKDSTAFITVKGLTRGVERLEFEYEIPYDDARAILQMCPPPIIDKIRHFVPYEGFTWEVDEYLGSLEGLTVAEIEVPAVDTRYALPPFVGKEVSDDPRYFNSNLGMPGN